MTDDNNYITYTLPDGLSLEDIKRAKEILDRPIPNFDRVVKLIIDEDGVE